MHYIKRINDCCLLSFPYSSLTVHLCLPVCRLPMSTRGKSKVNRQLMLKSLSSFINCFSSDLKSRLCSESKLTQKYSCIIKKRKEKTLNFRFIFDRYSEEDGVSMSPNGLRQFLEKEQSMKEVNAEFAVGLIRRFDPSPSKEMGRMTLAGN